MIRTVTLLFLLLQVPIYAQESVQRIVNYSRTEVSKMTPSSDERTLLVSADFAEAQLTPEHVPAGTIEKVYYFYTRYKKSPDFDQKALDFQRIKGLAKIFPSVLNDRYIHWELIEQTGCSTVEQGASYFHGFALVYRADPHTRFRDKEIERIEAFMKNPTDGFIEPDADAIATELLEEPSEEKAMMDSEANYPEGNFALYQYFRDSIPGGGKMALNRDDVWVPFTFEVGKDGSISDVQLEETKPYIKSTLEKVMKNMPKWDSAIENGEPKASRVNLEVRMSFSPIVRGMYNRDGEKPNFKQSEVTNFLSEEELGVDSETQNRIDRIEKGSVYQGLEQVVPREKVAVVMDVTSSMSQHIAGFSWWLMNSPDSLNIVHYTFFNDGDNMADRQKKIGETGGIHYGKKQFHLPEVLMTAMRSGNGGDLPENDIEALFETELLSDAPTLLLIADNFSGVRDLRLMEKLTAKTHVLISGEVTAVRACYLDLAKKTGGDIIVNGQRISLKNLNAGSQIQIAESTYRYDGEHFTIL